MAALWITGFGIWQPPITEPRRSGSPMALASRPLKHPLTLHSHRRSLARDLQSGTLASEQGQKRRFGRQILRGAGQAGGEWENCPMQTWEPRARGKRDNVRACGGGAEFIVPGRAGLES